VRESGPVDVGQSVEHVVDDLVSPLAPEDAHEAGNQVYGGGDLDKLAGNFKQTEPS
jgi:hypothetical protein